MHYQSAPVTTEAASETEIRVLVPGHKHPPEIDPEFRLRLPRETIGGLPAAAPCVGAVDAVEDPRELDPFRSEDLAESLVHGGKLGQGDPSRPHAALVAHDDQPHAELMQAVLARDVTRAQTLMAAHIGQTLEVFESASSGANQAPRAPD